MRARSGGVFPLPDETASGELVDRRAIHLLVEIEIEGVERAIGIAETRPLVPARVAGPVGAGARERVCNETLG